MGNLSAARDFVHVDDGAAAYRLLAEKGEQGGVYNLASGTATRMGDVLRRLLAIAGLEGQVDVKEGVFERPAVRPPLPLRRRRPPARSRLGAASGRWTTPSRISGRRVE